MKIFNLQTPSFPRRAKARQRGGGRETPSAKLQAGRACNLWLPAFAQSYGAACVGLAAP